MIYGSWDMECDGQNLCHVVQWQNLCPGYMSCYTNVPKIMIKWSYAKLFLRYKAWQMQYLFFILGYFLPCYPPLTTKKIKIKKKMKKKKTTRRYHYFTHVYQKLGSHDEWFLKYGARRMDRRTDGQKKWHIEMGVPTKKFWQVWKSLLQFSQNFGHITC